MGLLCLIAVFLPSVLLVVGALPFWEALRRTTFVQAALKGVNAAVVGLLLAALYHPVWTAGITGARDFAVAMTAFLLLFMWQWPPWLVVVLSAAAGAALAA
jgi:chromate transporter